MKNAVFCGTFDPFTLGHFDILRKAGNVFDKVFLAVSADNGKNSVLSLQGRIKIAKASTDRLPFVEIVSFSGLLTELCKAINVYNLVRGLRNLNDFVYERDLLRNYQSQCSTIECTYFITDSKFEHVSSSAVRELAKIGGNIENHVLKEVVSTILEEYSGK